MEVKELREALVKRAIEHDLPSTQPVKKNVQHHVLCSSYGPLGGPGCICLRLLRQSIDESL